MTDRFPVATPLPPLGSQPVVSVIMPVLDAAEVLPASVRAALAQQPEVREIMVAVWPRDEDTLAIARRLERDHDRVRVVVNPTGHTPDGLNAAIDAAKGDVLVRVDAHAVLPPDYVRIALGALRRTGAANVGGMQLPSAEAGFARCVAAAMRSPFGAGGAAYRSGARSGPVDTVYLGVFRREALEAVGGFDRRFRRNQDAELNRRLFEAGYTIWLEPSMAVVYRPRSTVAGLASQYWQYGRWRRLTAQVHPGSLRLRQLAAPALVVALVLMTLASLLLGSPVPLLSVLAGYLGVLLAAAAMASRQVRDVLPTALALAMMHLLWGVGFLSGPPRGGRVPSSLSTTDADG